MADRPVCRAMIEALAGRECLEHFAVIARLLSERIMTLIAMVLTQAATGDPELRAFAETIEGERATGNARDRLGS